MIEIKGLRKRYPGEPQDILKDVTFEIGEGEYVALMGESGSGKTTVLNVLGGLDSTYEGDVKVAGQPLQSLSDEALSSYRSQSLGFVFQSFHLLEHLSVRENVEMPAHFRGQTMGVSARLERVRECLEAVELGHKIDQLPKLLSGGERQRGAIASALFNRPPLLLCDEPTGALDTKTGENILSLFERLNRERGVTILVVTHSHEVSKRASRVIRLEDGALVKEEVA